MFGVIILLVLIVTSSLVVAGVFSESTESKILHLADFSNPGEILKQSEALKRVLYIPGGYVGNTQWNGKSAIQNWKDMLNDITKPVTIIQNVGAFDTDLYDNSIKRYYLISVIGELYNAAMTKNLDMMNVTYNDMDSILNPVLQQLENIYLKYPIVKKQVVGFYTFDEPMAYFMHPLQQRSLKNVNITINENKAQNVLSSNLTISSDSSINKWDITYLGDKYTIKTNGKYLAAGTELYLSDVENVDVYWTGESHIKSTNGMYLAYYDKVILTNKPFKWSVPMFSPEYAKAAYDYLKLKTKKIVTLCETGWFMDYYHPESLSNYLNGVYSCKYIPFDVLLLDHYTLDINVQKRWFSIFQSYINKVVGWVGIGTTVVSPSDYITFKYIYDQLSPSNKLGFGFWGFGTSPYVEGSNPLTTQDKYNAMVSLLSAI